MTRRLLLLLTAILATTATANDTADAEPFSVLTNTTLSCSLRLPDPTVGCYWERPVAVLGPLEIAVGVDAQAALSRPAESIVGGYVSLAAYYPNWSAWAELHLPRVAPVVGNPVWFRAGFSMRF